MQMKRRSGFTRPAGRTVYAWRYSTETFMKRWTPRSTAPAGPGSV